MTPQWSLSNPGPGSLAVWLEPWAEEVEVPPRSTIALATPNEFAGGDKIEVEWTPDHLVIWANSPTTFHISVDGAARPTSSASNPSPEGLNKQMLSLAFANLPDARLAGRQAETQRASWWRTALSRLGF